MYLAINTLNRVYGFCRFVNDCFLIYDGCQRELIELMNNINIDIHIYLKNRVSVAPDT